MKVKKGTGAEPGSYEGVFKEFMKTRGAKPSYVHNTKNGPVVRYIVRSDDGVDIPGSFPLDFDHYQCVNTLGCFGAPARAVKPLTKQMKLSQLMPQLEKKLVKNGARVRVWVPEQSEWIASINPVDGVFPVKFEIISTKDEDGTPIHRRKTGTRKGRGGKPYAFDEDRFTTILRVDSGPHEGAGFIYSLHYLIKKDSEGDYFVDTAGRDGKAFWDFNKMHGVDLSKVNPLKAADPNNILPELQARWKKTEALMTAEVEGGWIAKLTLVPTTQSVGDVLDLEADDEPRPGRRKRSKPKANVRRKKVDTGEVERAQAVTRQVINKEAGKTVYDKDGKLKLKATFRGMIRKYKLPKKDVSKYQLSECVTALNNLGYDNLAVNFTTKKRRRR